MTNDKAVKLLHRIADSQFDGIHGDERREALSMAVMALEQNLVQESGGLVNDLVKDCISRQQAIDALDMAIERYDEMAEECRRNANIERNDYMDMRDDAAEYRQLSTWLNELRWLRERFQSQPERKKGKWIKISPANIYECSKCGKNVMTDDISAYDFCHGCGADMRG